MTESLTIQEAIADSLVALVNAADGIDQRSFAEFLEAEASRLAKRSQGVPQVCGSSVDTEAQLQFVSPPIGHPASTTPMGVVSLSTS